MGGGTSGGETEDARAFMRLCSGSFQLRRRSVRKPALCGFLFPAGNHQQRRSGFGREQACGPERRRRTLQIVLLRALQADVELSPKRERQGRLLGREEVHCDVPRADKLVEVGAVHLNKQEVPRSGLGCEVSRAARSKAGERGTA